MSKVRWSKAYLLGGQLVLPRAILKSEDGKYVVIMLNRQGLPELIEDWAYVSMRQDDPYAAAMGDEMFAPTWPSEEVYNAALEAAMEADLDELFACLTKPSASPSPPDTKPG